MKIKLLYIEIFKCITGHQKRIRKLTGLGPGWGGVGVMKTTYISQVSSFWSLISESSSPLTTFLGHRESY